MHIYLFTRPVTSPIVVVVLVVVAPAGIYWRFRAHIRVRRPGPVYDERRGINASRKTYFFLLLLLVGPVLALASLLRAASSQSSMHDACWHHRPPPAVSAASYQRGAASHKCAWTGVSKHQAHTALRQHCPCRHSTEQQAAGVK